MGSQNGGFIFMKFFFMEVYKLIKYRVNLSVYATKIMPKQRPATSHIGN